VPPPDIAGAGVSLACISNVGALLGTKVLILGCSVGTGVSVLSLGATVEASESCALGALLTGAPVVGAIVAGGDGAGEV
jgi:hypothetical protein